MDLGILYLHQTILICLSAINGANSARLIGRRRNKMYKFLKELSELMDKHEIICITASDEYDGYPKDVGNIQICIQGKTDYVDIGAYIDPDCLKIKILELLG